MSTAEFNNGGLFSGRYGEYNYWPRTQALFRGGKGKPGTNCLHIHQKSWEFRFFHKISSILLRVLNVNYPWHYRLFQLYCYLPRLLVSVVMKTCNSDYFRLGRPVVSRNFERQERDLSIGDLVGLHRSSSLFKVLDDYFLPTLFHIDVVFQKPTLLHGALAVLLYSPDAVIYIHCTRPTCSLVVTGWFTETFLEILTHVYQALLSPHEREPGFEASMLQSTLYHVVSYRGQHLLGSCLKYGATLQVWRELEEILYSLKFLR